MRLGTASPPLVIAANGVRYSCRAKNRPRIAAAHPASRPLTLAARSAIPAWWRSALRRIPGRRNDIRTTGTRGETDEDVGFCRAARRRIDGGRAGAGCRRRRAIVRQVPPLPRRRAGRQDQARTPAQRDRRPQVRHLSPASTIPTPSRASASPGTQPRSSNGSSNPSAMVPGTRMAFSGIKDDDEIGNLWAYLNQFKDDGNEEVAWRKLYCASAARDRFRSTGRNALWAARRVRGAASHGQGHRGQPDRRGPAGIRGRLCDLAGAAVRRPCRRRRFHLRAGDPRHRAGRHPDRPDRGPARREHQGGEGRDQPVRGGRRGAPGFRPRCASSTPASRARPTCSGASRGGSTSRWSGRPGPRRALPRSC